MARSLRIEKEGGVYHVINRGNYRRDLFINEGAHLSFENAMFEACEKCGWVLEGWCVMTNHFHLVIRTPKGNLVYGMKWLQSVFANRYHRFRKVNGKLFQGRYKSLIVEEDSYLGALLHYVHLNPVRAGLCSADTLKDYRWSSYWYLRHPSKRPVFLDCSGALMHAGGLADTSYGRRKYQDYLTWLAANSAEQKKMAFEKMCRGWALGSKDFKEELICEFNPLKKALDCDDGGERVNLEGSDLREANELLWEKVVVGALGFLGKDEGAILSDRKSARWKVIIAAALKRKTSATNVWITRRLNMGIPQAVSQNVGRFRQEGGESGNSFKKLIIRITE